MAEEFELELDALEGIDLGQLHVLAMTIADACRAKYPDLPILTPTQVADVLYNTTSRGVVNGIRDRLTAGTLPGIPVGERWEIRVEDLIRVYDEMAEQAKEAREAKARGPMIQPKGPGAGSATGKRPWRAPSGKRVGAMKFQGFFQEVYRELDLLDANETADQLRGNFPGSLPGGRRTGI